MLDGGLCFPGRFIVDEGWDCGHTVEGAEEEKECSPR